MNLQRVGPIIQRLLALGVPTVALLMLGLILVPAELWHRPAYDAIYRGFDSNLIYVSEKGYPFPNQGVVQVSPETVILTAMPNSLSTVHLVTTPYKSFVTSMEVQVLESRSGTTPLRIGIWSPRAKSGYFLNFGPPPDNLIKTETVVKGIPAQTLVGGEFIKNEALASYFPSRLYHLDFTLDKEAGTIKSRLTGQEEPPSGGALLRLVGGPGSPDYRDVISEAIPINEGDEYILGGLTKVVVPGIGAYKIDVQWLDKGQNHLGFAPGWQTIRELNGGWTERKFKATAPSKAAFARLILGSGDGSQLLFAGLFLARAIIPHANLLTNGQFRKGSEGWIFVDHPPRTPEIIEPDGLFLESLVTSKEAPELFDSLRLSLTASSASQAGIARVALANYTLTLPHQRWEVVKVKDGRATGLVIALLALASLLVIFKIALWVYEKSHRETVLASFTRVVKALSGPISFPVPVPVLGVTLVVAAFIAFNAFLFSKGNLPFDMIDHKIGAYVAAFYGPQELYLLPNVVSLAKVWGGAPYHEAVYPYHPVMAYISTAIGLMYRFFWVGPDGPFVDTLQLEFLIKSFNVVFSIGSGALIYLILRDLGVGKRWGLLAGSLFLLNPAVWFSASVWGQTHVISLFFLLASIWLAERKCPLWAWLALVATALTRVQMLVPAFLLGLVFLRRFSLKENLYAVSWTIVLFFLILAPFSLAISPSMPVDLFANLLFVQEAGGNERALTTVSLDAFNIWPLVTYFSEGVQGRARFYYPSAEPLIGLLSFQRISQILTLGVVLGMGALIMFRPKSGRESGDYLPFLTLGTLGFLMLKTGLAGTHFLMGLPLIILCRRWLHPANYYFLVAVWSVTTLVSMYGSLGFGISDVGDLAPALHHTKNMLTRLFMYLQSADWFITLGVSANVLVVLWLAMDALRSARLLEKARQSAPIGS